MFIKAFRSIGITTDVMYLLGFASIGASIATWAKAKASGDEAHAERFGIFIGLWAPTFMALGNAIANSKQVETG
ncbi:MAG: hypothetical protein AAF945_03345 [Actinomycetota bacterium]